MIFAAQAETLLHFYRKSMPKVYHQMNLMKQLIASPGGVEKQDGPFTMMPSHGFSKIILGPDVKHLRVIRAEGVAWSDWKNAARVQSDIRRSCAVKETPTIPLPFAKMSGGAVYA
jgi:hypothetical protein